MDLEQRLKEQKLRIFLTTNNQFYPVYKQIMGKPYVGLFKDLGKSGIFKLSDDGRIEVDLKELQKREVSRDKMKDWLERMVGNTSIQVSYKDLNNKDLNNKDLNNKDLNKGAGNTFISLNYEGVGAFLDQIYVSTEKQN